MIKVSIQQLAEEGVGFGTSGVRGLVTELTPTVCAAYTTAFLSQINSYREKRVAIGTDLRPSSPGIAAACASAIEAAGFEVEFCGALPTPGLAYHAMRERIPAVMITGSHIPFDRNGIKFYLPEGEISKSDEAAIMGATVELPELPDVSELAAENGNAKERYIKRYLKFFPSKVLSGLRLGFYEHSSVARDILSTLLRNLGAEVVALDRTDEFVPIDTEAVSDRDRERGKRWSEKHGFDALISTDGDADRPLLGDERGNWLRGDVVGLLCARYLEAEAVVTPVSSTTTIERSGWFKEVRRTRIGSPFVIEGMEAAAADGWGPVVGFEANGGFLLGSAIERNGAVLEPLPTRDAVLPIIALLALCREKQVPLSALEADLPQRFTASDRIRDFERERSDKLMATLTEDPTPLEQLYGEVVSRNETDGLRLTFASGDIVHLRPSGNAPELRCYAEAGQPDRAEVLVQEVLERVKNMQ